MSSAPHSLRLVPPVSTDEPADSVAETDMHGISGNQAGDAGVTSGFAADDLPGGPLGDQAASPSAPLNGGFMSEAQLFKRFAPYVARIGLRLLGRESDVDDLIQEVITMC